MYTDVPFSWQNDLEDYEKDLLTLLASLQSFICYFKRLPPGKATLQQSTIARLRFVRNLIDKDLLCLSENSVADCEPPVVPILAEPADSCCFVQGKHHERAPALALGYGQQKRLVAAGLCDLNSEIVSCCEHVSFSGKPRQLHWGLCSVLCVSDSFYCCCWSVSLKSYSKLDRMGSKKKAEAYKNEEHNLVRVGRAFFFSLSSGRL